MLQRLKVSLEQIFLDDAEDQRCDAEDQRCAAVVDRWRQEGLQTEEVGTPTGRLIHARWRP